MLRSILQRPNTQVKTPVCYIQQQQQQRGLTYSLIRSSLDTTTSEAAAAAAADVEPSIKLSRRRRRFHEWVRGTGSKYARPSDGTTNYLGTTTPFPNNPFFQPRPPLSDTQRENIYQLYTSHPETWTVRQLAVKFGYSLKRIEAVLKLKSSEKVMEAQGISLQHEFTKGMEQSMGANQPATLLQEPLIDIFPNVSKPRFKVLEEHADFTAKDAADVLNRKQYTLLEKRVIASEEAKFKSQASSSSTTISFMKPGKFVIVDTSKN